MRPQAAAVGVGPQAREVRELRGRFAGVKEGKGMRTPTVPIMLRLRPPGVV